MAKAKKLMRPSSYGSGGITRKSKGPSGKRRKVTKRKGKARTRTKL